MIYPQLLQIVSQDLQPPALPADPVDCEVAFHAIIGPREGEGSAESFGFTVTTPAHLGRTLGHTWGRGYLIVESFDWEIVVRAIAQLLAQCARPTWPEVAYELNKELHWERERERGG
jgi:hypothetical protein